MFSVRSESSNASLYVANDRFFIVGTRCKEKIGGDNCGSTSKIGRKGAKDHYGERGAVSYWYLYLWSE